MVDRNYGYALYYPFIHFQNDDWFKTAALYYDGIKRIVTEGFKTRDSSIVEKMINQTDFVQNYSPGYETSEISRNFIEMMKENYKDPNARSELLKTIKKEINPNGIFPIHDEKLAISVRDILPELGVKKAENSSWYLFDPVSGSLYMTTLAERIAERQGLPLVSDTEGYQKIINTLQFDKSRDKIRPDIGYQLASFIIKGVVPKNIKEIKVEQIIKFRENHEGERYRFYEEIQNMIVDMPKINDAESLNNYVSHRENGIKDQLEQFKNSLTDAKITSTDCLIGISAPPIAVELSTLLPQIGPQIIASSFILAGASLLYGKYIQFKKIRNNSPLSYLISLEHNLAPDNILRRLLS